MAKPKGLDDFLGGGGRQEGEPRQAGPLRQLVGDLVREQVAGGLVQVSGSMPSIERRRAKNAKIAEELEKEKEVERLRRAQGLPPEESEDDEDEEDRGPTLVDRAKEAVAKKAREATAQATQAVAEKTRELLARGAKKTEVLLLGEPTDDGGRASGGLIDLIFNAETGKWGLPPFRRKS